MQNGNGIVKAVAEIMTALSPGQRVAVLLRHGTTGDQKDRLPNDTVSAASRKSTASLGTSLRKGGLMISRIIVSPRGRAVATAMALGEGNAESSKNGGTVAEFCTDPAISDVSSDVKGHGPEMVAEAKAYAQKHGVSGEEALLLSDDPEVNSYMWKRANEYARCIRTRVKMGTGEPMAFVAHGGPLDVAILRLLNPLSRSLGELGKPKKWLDKGEAAVAVFDKTGDCVKVVYL